MNGNAYEGFDPSPAREDERLMGQLRDLLRTVDDLPEAVRESARDIYGHGPPPGSGPDGARGAPGT